MDDRDLIDRITHLVAEEQKMAAGEHDPAKLRELEVTLDQLWDLLRQRRSQEEFAKDPGAVKERDPKTVEGYLQ